MCVVILLRLLLMIMLLRCMSGWRFEGIEEKSLGWCNGWGRGG